MLGHQGKLSRLARKIGDNVRLLARDPEAFARNLMQVTNPTLFESRLVDVLNASPMQVHFDPLAERQPRLNVLDAAWTQSGMTGGPNTVVNLVVRVARRGVPVRLVSTMPARPIASDWFRQHVSALLGGEAAPSIELASAANKDTPLPLGPGDVFLVTHWTTAQQLRAILPHLPVRRFFYMLQEFEPGFYPWSSNYARAIETYGMDFWPIINEKLLAEHLLKQPHGTLSDPATRRRALIFEPAVDETLFHPGTATASPRPKRLLFYARPTNARNMFGLGLMALRQAASNPAFDGWEFLSIGSRGSVPKLQLCDGHVMRPAPWMDYTGYGDFLRQAGILLCPMLSPHTS